MLAGRWGHLRIYAARLTVIGLLAALGAMLEAATLTAFLPLISAMAGAEGTELTGSVGLFDNEWTVGALTTACLAFIALRVVVSLVLAHLSADLVTRYEIRQRQSLLHAYLHASWDRQARERSGALQDGLTTDVYTAMGALQSLAMGMAALIGFLVLLAVAVSINPLFAGFVVLLAAVLFGALRPLSRRAERHATERNRLNEEFAHEVSQAVSLVRDIRAYGVAEAVEGRVAFVVRAGGLARRRLAFVSQAGPALYQNVALLLVVTSLGMLYAFDVPLVSTGAVILLLVRSTSYGQQVQAALHVITESGPTFTKIDDRLASFDASQIEVGSSDLGAIRSIALDHVSFAYQPRRRVLRDVTATIERGEVIGVIGPSGSGKSTLVQLLLRLRTPTEGQILVNGEPSLSYTRATWAQRMAFVPQEPQLLDATASENIRFLRPSISDQDVERAARAAGIHDEITSWSGGYKTPVGDRNSAVSGGQRQRICIARALAGHPDVILLDEPTSALDIHSEAAIQQTFADLRGQVTFMIVAHRLSTLAYCDKIMVLREGCLQGFAPADELRLSDAYFAEVIAMSGLS